MLIKYREMGFPVIPVRGKVACIKEWDRWCLELPPMELVEKWAKEFPFPYYGIALCAGPAANIDALDIDSESNDILDMCPRSPISRRGARGGMPLFQHNPTLIKREQDRDNLTPDATGKKREGIQVLSTGNYFVLPPSIHPITKQPYIWTTEYNLENLCPMDLEPLTQESVDRPIAYISTFPLEGRTGARSSMSAGRNNHLASVCCAIIMRAPYKTDEQVAEELIVHDATYHGTPYFSDPGEMYYRKAPTPFERALLFVRGSRKRLARKSL